jgi:hypothetical protein
MKRSHAWMVIYEYEVLGAALNLISTKLPRPWSPRISSPSKKNTHGWNGCRTRDLMISSQKLWPLDHEAGHNERMLQRTVFINKIRMLQRWRRNTTGRRSTRVRMTSRAFPLWLERLSSLLSSVRFSYQFSSVICLFVQCVKVRLINFILFLHLYFYFPGGTLLVAQLVEALCSKPEGRGFDSRWYHWHNPSGSTMTLGLT